MSQQQEDKHNRFLRLMQRRLERALEELRLVSQLSSSNYENTPDEAQEVVRHLDASVRHIAQVFAVPYATRIGKGAAHTTNGSGAIGPIIRKTAVIDEVEIMHILDDLRADKIPEAMTRLRAGIGVS